MLQTMEEFYLDGKFKEENAQEDDVDDALIRSAAGRGGMACGDQAAQSKTSLGDVPKTSLGDVPLPNIESLGSCGTNVDCNKVIPSSLPSPSPSPPASPVPQCRGGLHVGVGGSVIITPRNHRYKDMIGTVVALVGNGNRAR